MDKEKVREAIRLLQECLDSGGEEEYDEMESEDSEMESESSGDASDKIKMAAALMKRKMR